MERAWDAAGRHAVEGLGPQKAPVGMQLLMMMLGDGAFAIFRSVICWRSDSAAQPVSLFCTGSPLGKA
jgi:hypothetical protein